MSCNLNEEYKEYLLDILVTCHEELVIASRNSDILSPKKVFEYDYVEDKINQFRDDSYNLVGYDKEKDWKHSPYIYNRILSYNTWLKQRRNERARQVLNS